MYELCELLVVLGLLAPQNEPNAIVRGYLLEWDGSEAGGELSVRTADHHVYRFLFDGRTYFERDKQRIAISGTRKGELLEIVAEGGPGSRRSYALSVHALEARPLPKAPPSRARLGAFRSLTESIFPRGNLTFSGVVVRDRKSVV